METCDTIVVFSWSGPVPWGRAAAHRSIDHQCIVIVAFALRSPLFFAQRLGVSVALHKLPRTLVAGTS